ncbi:PREDICTED: LOW QUALITY PROTEIN: probable E3 ubiquitin-protein ligase HECTD4 [Priapulus caudatus]|uniref:LOW QUALITY PROTEIN: probable E3 ubiquitin-protein ligase HECTD4 n=1 Tax=Priapulus caudatus TaxID=37621 RepID=A0ABM1EU10_PRICU|nr:PREDICTED: LOW QUALITY PROTEIN: probable E3 ubiquitin-protein ligase HECTD4 [Priapulus caudatus]
MSDTYCFLLAFVISRLPDDLVQLLLKIVMKESSSLLRECTTPDHVEFDRILASVPMTSVCLQYMMALQSHLLRNIVLYTAAESGGVAVQPKPSSPSLQNMQAHIIQYAKKVFSGTEEVLETLHEVCNALINSGAADLEWRLQGLERIAKATALGHLLPVLISSLTHYNACCLGMADKLMPQLVQLIILTSQAALLLKSQVQAMRDTEAFVSSTDMLQIMEGSLSLQNYEVGEKEECGFLAGLKIPAPWATGKSVESSHPLRDNYKFKETVHIPGARCLFLRFDIRCSSQYDYDKLILYAGPGLNSRKVAEYGGNTLGFGSRSVLGSGWPKDLVKVEGDTVTFSFEMRSGREHNTPDKAMWGFLVTVRAQSIFETKPIKIKDGPPSLTTRTHARQLLKSRLLQRCLWQREHGNLIAPMELVGSSLSATIREESELSANAAVLPRIKLPSEVMQRLRQLSGFAAPQFRPSIREVIEPEKIEESIVSAVVKHLGLADTVRHLVAIQQHDSEEYCLLCVVLIDTYRKMDSLLRQLQTIAELEQRWQNEVNDIRQGMMPASMSFFAGYHLTENKSKELALLCYLKEVEWDPITQENCVTNLRGLLEIEASSPSREPPVTMQKTRKLVASVLERTELLLHVTIATDARQQESMAQSLTQIPDATSRISPERPPPTYGRSVSFNGTQSLDDSTIDIHTLRRKRQRKGPVAVLQDLAGSEEGEKDQPAHALLLDQLFSFVGSNPERAVACQSFLSAAQVRWRRGHTRKQALVHMKELLTAACRVGGATHLVAAVTSVLQHGPRIEELTCGGMVEEVREAFAETMASVVQLCARYPLACCNSIGLLCIIPYTRNEEKCLVRSGLVGLLDKLCNMSAGKTEAPSASVQSPHHLVALMAWAGFQVLSSRCVTWEKDEGLFEEELEHSGLAWQVSALLSNHLTRATENSGNEAAGNEALQEVLNLLNNLSRSNMGKAILSQPACVSKLLSLLLDQRPSPNLILIILQLCRVALPLMMATDCAKVELPSWSRNVTAYASDVDLSDPPAKIASLLLAKLGDFVVPGSRLTTSQHSADALMQEAAGRQKMEKEADAHDGRLSVFLHKREDQSSHEVLQPLLSGSDSPFRLTSGANMEKIVRMDRDMTKHGKTEIFTEDAVSALRRAAKMAQAGMIVSTGPLVEAAATTGGGGGGGGGGPEGGDRKKMAVEAVCKDKNSELARMDPVRPFISGHVANSMATEVIALLHSLLTAPETSAAQIWTSAVKRVLSNALSCVPLLVQQCEHMSSKACNVPMLLAMARQAAGALCALGGFHETIKPGSKVQVIGDGIHLSTGSVLRVAEAQGMATVLLDIPPDYSYPRASDTIELPIARLVPPYNEMLPLGKLSITRKVIDALLALLVGRDGRSPLLTPLPMHGDGTSMVLATARVIAEIRTRACMVLAAYLKDVFFASAFIQHSVMAVDVIKALSTECNIGESSLPCVKPFTWDTARIFPPVRACLFSHSLTGVTFLGEPGTASGLPRGTLVYANQPIPPQATSFYFEIEICSFGELQDDSGPIISFGFAPPAERKDGSWTNPVGTVMFHNNGRAVHYNGSSLLQWKSVRLDVALTAGDVAGIFWQQEGEEPPPGQPAEYNSDQCLVYRLEKSYSNLLTTGPDPHPALCLADDTEESEVQEEPEEDYYALLVKAWEQKIFPVIRRRFRNEAERKDGLEQIKGALQLGMVDIARQTVEFLYEENGGMPRDLHLPNIDDIKEEAAKVTVDRVHKGMAVVIQNPGSTVLPPFAVRGMLRMFGLTGVVLDVDTQHELVQVEAYLRSDGVLVRYWFPLHMLERPQQGHRRTTVTGSQVLDVSNINIHRELLGCEADLARMYCRSALLQLIEQCSTPQPPQVCDIVGFAATMAASTSLLQELHVENLQLLSNELLITAQPAGPLTCCSLVASPSLRQTLARHSCSASDVFYGDQRRLKRELEAVIERVAGQGEQCLIELTNNICVCLQIAPEDFPSEEMPVTEGKLATDVSILGASFLIVSCLRDPKTATSNEYVPPVSGKAHFMVPFNKVIKMDMLWFHRALTMSQMLRHLAYDDTQGEGMTADAVTDAAQMIATVTAPCRLLIVTGIPIALEQEFVKQAIRKASSAAGGLFRDEVWVLSTDDPGLPRRDAINEAARRAGSPGGAHKRGIKGCAVLEVRSKCKVESCKRALLGSREFLAGISDDMLDVAEMEVLTVATVTANLLTEPPAGVVLEEYLYYKLMLGEGSLSDPAMTALTEIFHSCFLCEHTLTFSDPKQDSGYICLTKDQIMSQSPGNLMYAFCAAVRSPKKTLQEQVSYLLSTYGITKHESQASKDGRTVVKRPGKPMKEKSGFGQKYVVEVKDRKMKVKDVTLEKQKENLMAVAAARRDTGKEGERRLLTLDGLAQFVCDKAKLDCKVIWRALLSCGYDIHFDRFSCIDVASGPLISCFADIPIEGARLRFAMLQTLGSVLESFLLPLVDLRAAEAFPQSTAALLRRCSSLIFYDNKVAFMNRVLNATAQRKSDQAAPEITLDPLEVIGAEVSEVTGTQFAQAMRQLGSVPSSQLCVRLASGGDPVYAFNVRYTGEEVHGTSGSFRHFLSQVTRELHSPLLSLLLPCPSGAVGRNKGMYVLRPGAMSCAEERLLVFFGQLLGITVRADIPLALDMLPVFWKAILCCHIDVNAELPEVDLLTDKYCKKLLSLATEQDFSEMCEQEGGQVRFVYRTLSGDEVQLCPNGHNTLLSWHNRQQFVEAVLGLRATELTSRERVTAIRAGMASIIPLQLLTIMSPADMELRTCGKFFVNLSFLKTHTMYQVGLTESDKHIEYFWNALERFSQDELCKFVKFACNQERIPMMCPCRDGSQETAHVPPYPMKIAPPDGRAGSADSRHVRVETCMFMVKLPQYSCQEVMTERLLAAIHSRDDPLSG